MFAKGTLLGRDRPVNTTEVSIFTATLPTEVTKIFVTNTTGSAATFRIHHDVAGSGTYNQDNALYYDKNVPANDTVIIELAAPGAGIQLDPDDELIVRSGTGDALNFSAYGATADLAEQQRRT